MLKWWKRTPAVQRLLNDEEVLRNYIAQERASQ